ncbi:MAG: hypothetical protein MUF48_12510 [Pirellulaceae bacterium]|nr:hypothetical protein [Pirellulaceae bacterium]
MNRSTRCCRFVLGLVLVITGPIAAAGPPVDSAAARKIFADPPRQYATAPLWTWNDMLTEEQIRSTMRDLAGQKVMQVFVHPRPGLMTPYLSDDWFRLWKAALDEAEKLDMNVWIYDENSYPSGFAGGHVPELMPESRGRGLVLRDEEQVPQLSPDIVAVYRVTPDALERVTEKLRQGEELPAGRYVVAAVVRAADSPWHGDRSYVDLMYPGVTEKFLEVTLDAYKQHVGEQFGKRVLGAFTDEPNVRPAGGLPWTDHLPAAFQQRWGYDLLDHLPSLVRPVGPWKQVRHDYFQVVLDQFIQHWAQPYYSWCERHGIAFTGHYWDHEWPHCIGVTDNMAMSAWQQIPGIDCLMNQYREDTHAQFGNLRFVREVQSLCNQLGRERFLCEVYGAGGWDLRFEDMKRIADWLGVLGVNFFDEHVSYVTIRGARKADHPQSFSYHEPWWDSYHVMAQYITRLSAAMSLGQQQNRVLVIQPTTTAWMYQPDPGHQTQLDQLGKTFFDLLLRFEQAQVEYDIGCEDVMARHGAVRTTPPGVAGAATKQLHVGERAYDTIVLAPMTETLRSETMHLLEEYAAAGGRILACCDPPALVDGRPSARGAALAGQPGWQSADPLTATDALRLTLQRDGCAIRRADGDGGILFHQRRQLADGELLLLVNTSIETPSAGVVESAAQGVEQWDLFSGQCRSYPHTTQSGITKCEFSLPPCGSLLLFLSQQPGASQAVASAQVAPLAPVGSLDIRRCAPNVLTLDYVDIAAGDQQRENLYYYRANQLAWQQNGLDRNPWDSAVQFRDELISKTFPPQSGFEVTYRFHLDRAVPEGLSIVIERPDLYTITCNGSPVTAPAGSWWLDKSFGKIDLTRVARPGPNAVTLRAQPFTMFHEIAPAYVLGDFSLRATASGFVIVPPETLVMDRALAHATDIEGVAWLSSGIGFQRDPAAEEGNDGAPYIAFDLGKLTNLSAIDIWNYNEAAATGRGIRRLEVRGSATPEGPAAWSLHLGTFDLARAPGGPAGTKTAFAQRLPIEANGVRYIKFTIVSNHNGVTFPATDGGTDHAFVGLSEVRFYTPQNSTPLAGVTIRGVSSELVVEGGFDRRAVHAVDGSGLGEVPQGWHQQGMPFYADAVAYTQSFRVDQPRGRYRVAVPKWYGSVAKVVVNDQLCGHLVSQPWEVDVTSAIRPGENSVQILVTGTLKNTLGPHHGSPGVGSAWPGMFQQGPEQGPPPGAAYHTLGYGLFEPFALLHVSESP